MMGISILRKEHQAIVIMVEVLKKCAIELEKENYTVLETIEKTMDFFKNFTDRCHHMKEELYLFPLLISKGMPKEGGPVGVMLSEHSMGRNLISNIISGVKELEKGNGSVESLKENILQYANLLENHITKENEILFNMAEQLLTVEEQADLAILFDKLEKEEIGEGVHEEYHKLIHDLAKKFAIS